MLDQSTKDSVAGAAAGISQTLSGQPFDTVKVRLQTAPELYPQGVLQCVRATWAQGGIRSFYRGTLSPLFGSAICNSIQFSTMEASKRFLREQSGHEKLTLSQLYACGFLAGVANTPVLSPMELVRIKMQVPSAKGRYTGSWDCLRKIIHEDGVRGVFQGVWPSLLRESIGFGFFFASYELMVSLWCAPGESVEDLSPLKVLASGSMGGICFWLPVFPLDVIKSRIQADDLRAPKYRGFNDCVRQIYRSEGLVGFYRGFVPCAARATPVNALTFLAFETSMRLMGRGTTSAVDSL